MLDALDREAGDVVQACSHLMPMQDKTAAMNAASVDFQWITGKPKLLRMYRLMDMNMIG